MTVLLLVGSFLLLWVGTTLILDGLRWLRPRRSLADRLAPYATTEWVDDVESWLHDTDEKS